MAAVAPPEDVSVRVVGSKAICTLSRTGEEHTFTLEERSEQRDIQLQSLRSAAFVRQTLQHHAEIQTVDESTVATALEALTRPSEDIARCRLADGRSMDFSIPPAIKLSLQLMTVPQQAVFLSRLADITWKNQQLATGARKRKAEDADREKKRKRKRAKNGDADDVGDAEDVDEDTLNVVDINDEEARLRETWGRAGEPPVTADPYRADASFVERRLITDIMTRVVATSNSVAGGGSGAAVNKLSEAAVDLMAAAVEVRLRDMIEALIAIAKARTVTAASAPGRAVASNENATALALVHEQQRARATVLQERQKVALAAAALDIARLEREPERNRALLLQLDVMAREEAEREARSTGDVIAAQVGPRVAAAAQRDVLPAGFALLAPAQQTRYRELRAKGFGSAAFMAGVPAPADGGGSEAKEAVSLEIEMQRLAAATGRRTVTTRDLAFLLEHDRRVSTPKALL